MKRILYFRHDKIGDFVLAWPALAMLKRALPEASIEVFVTPVVASLAEACPYVDHIILDTGDDKAIRAQIAERNYDGIVMARSQVRTMFLVRGLGVPYVVAPKLHWYQYCYKHRVNIQMGEGEPVWRKGCRLTERLLRDNDIPIPSLPTQYWDLSAERPKWQAFYQKQADSQLVFVHAGTGGSSGSLPTSHFVSLIRQIHEQTEQPCQFVLTYSGEERKLAEEIHQALADTPVNVALAPPLDKLVDFAKSLVAADMFIAGSTGPLHLAGLHDVPTVGFYAARRSAVHVKWQTLSQAHKRLSFTPPPGRRDGRNMALVDVDLAASKVAAFLNQDQGK
ncbi:glycosyltransferase family 9 protein [Ferrimonas marina]|nr:glycosyltransferase family 9 protein [Ferrimonas marina]